MFYSRASPSPHAPKESKQADVKHHPVPQVQLEASQSPLSSGETDSCCDQDVSFPNPTCGNCSTVWDYPVSLGIKTWSKIPPVWWRELFLRCYSSLILLAHLSQEHHQPQIHRAKAGPRSRQKTSPWVEVQIKGGHSCRLALLQHRSGGNKCLRADLK